MPETTIRTGEPMPRLARDGSAAPGAAYAWYVVAILTLANISGWVDRQILGVLVRPIEREFGITDTQMSYLVGLAFALFFAVVGLPIGRLADRYSRRNIMASGVALWSVFTTLSATARTYARFFMFRVGVGVGEATLNAPAVSLLADYFPRERLGRAMGVFSLGSFVGSGIGYFIGGWVAQLAESRGSVVVPLLGVIRPWQTAFIIVGLPGLVIAALFFTIREPARLARADGATQPSIGLLYRYVGDNWRTYLSHGLGFAVWLLVNLGLAFWIPALFERTYGWEAARASRVQGLLTMSIGVVGVLSGGWVTDWFVRRGKTDAPLRVGILGGVGMLASATAFPLMPSATLAVAMLAVVNFFAAFPWGAAAAGIAEIAPTPLRAQSAALYFFVSSLVAGTLGPTSVALLTDHVFGAAGIRYSVATVSFVGMLTALVLFLVGLGSFRRTLATRDAWMDRM